MGLLMLILLRKGSHDRFAGKSEGEEIHGTVSAGLFCGIWPAGTTRFIRISIEPVRIHKNRVKFADWEAIMRATGTMNACSLRAEPDKSRLSEELIMRKNFGAKPYLYPQPVLIIATYGEDGTPDAMNAAWGGISDENRISICLSAGHKTVRNILARKAFTVSMADVDHVVACDYVGIVSGNSVPDKFERAGFHAARSAFVDAPLIEELPMALECRLISYDEETEVMVGEIVNVCADEGILNGEGKIDPDKLRPIAYDAPNHAYLALGERVGSAFQDGQKLK